MNIITRVNDLEAFLPMLASAKEAVLDTETTGVELWKRDRLCGIGLGLEGKDYFYLSYRHQINQGDMPLFANITAPNDNLPLETLPTVMDAIQRVPVLIGHNIKFDVTALHMDGYIPGEHQVLEDTMTGGRLQSADKHPDLSLDGLVHNVLKKNDQWKKKFIRELERGGWKGHFDQAPASLVGPYCVGDLGNTWELRETLVQHIHHTGQQDVWEQECHLLKILWEMERAGVQFDYAYCMDRIPKLEARLRQLEKQVWEIFGMEFNIASTDQLTEAFSRVGVKPVAWGKPHVKTGKRKAQWGVAELMQLNHPAVGMIIEIRTIEKIKNTYFEPLLEWKDHILHCRFLPWGTVTGRMSCKEPNLQNISRGSQNLLGEEMSEEVLKAFQAMLGAYQGQHVDLSGGTKVSSVTGATVKGVTTSFVDDDLTVSVRRLYVPREGHNLWFIDFSQMEMRVFADYVKDDQLTALLEDPNFDFHGHVAAQVWHVDKDHALWKFYRTLAKAINFGLIYGIGLEKLAAQIQKSEEEAKVYKDDYFARFPKAKAFIGNVSRTIETRGYVKNRFGRRYDVVRDKAYTAVNYLIQGTSADIVKRSMLEVDKLLKRVECRTKMLLQVHDELIFEVPYDEERMIIPQLRDAMEKRHIETFLPVEVSKGFPSWAQKKEMCLECWDVKKEGHQCWAGLVMEGDPEPELVFEDDVIEETGIVQ